MITNIVNKIIDVIVFFRFLALKYYDKSHSSFHARHIICALYFLKRDKKRIHQIQLKIHSCKPTNYGSHMFPLPFYYL